MQTRCLPVCRLVSFASVVLVCAAGAGANEPVYRIYAGNTHSHTSNTWSHGDHYLKAPPGASKAKRGKKQLRPDWQKHQGSSAAHFAIARTNAHDFYIVADHSQEAAFQPVSATNAAWLGAGKEALEATDGGFVAIRGFEHSENNGPNGTGHINVINSRDYLNAMLPGVDLPYLYKWLKAAGPNGEGPVVASFNHPGAQGYNDWAFCDPEVADVITLLEVINSNNKLRYQAFVNALDKGWKVSPVCGNDNHGFWGILHHTSRTFVLATAKTRTALLEAMKNRRTYASLEGNIQCRYTVNGAIMGSTLRAADSFEFDISASDPDLDKPEDRITKLDIVGNGGAVLSTQEFEPASAVHHRTVINDSTNTYFFVRVWNAGGGDAPGARPDRPVAWLAPVWTGR